MVMGSDCDSELRLWPGGLCSSTKSYPPKQKQQQLTIFYGGRVSVSQVTEIQARAIISMAKLEMERMKSKNHHEHQCKEPSPPPPAVSQLLNQGLSTKRSLQQFLQKRRTRIYTSSPYNHKPHLPSMPSS